MIFYYISNMRYFFSFFSLKMCCVGFLAYHVGYASSLMQVPHVVGERLFLLCYVRLDFHYSHVLMNGEMKLC